MPREQRDARDFGVWEQELWTLNPGRHDISIIIEHGYARVEHAGPEPPRLPSWFPIMGGRRQ